MLAKRSSTLISFGILENGSLTFFLGNLATGSGGSGGESLRVAVVVTVFTTLVTFGSTSESEDESEESEGDSFLGPSERVALVSEPTTAFFSSSEESESLFDDSESEAGSGVFLASELVEESESLSEEEDLLSEVLLAAAETFFTLGTSSSELESDSESEDEESLSEGFEDFLGDLAFEGSSSELESESEDELEDELESALTFFAFGASSSELELDPDEEDSLLDEALRFRLLALGFGAGAFASGVSFSSSASLSELLEEEDDDEEDEEYRLVGTFFAGGASSISTSLSSRLSLLLSLLLSSCLTFSFFADLCFLVLLFSSAIFACEVTAVSPLRLRHSSKMVVRDGVPSTSPGVLPRVASSVLKVWLVVVNSNSARKALTSSRS